jgi:hypothetical protein
MNHFNNDGYDNPATRDGERKLLTDDQRRLLLRRTTPRQCAARTLRADKNHESRLDHQIVVVIEHNHT